MKDQCMSNQLPEHSLIFWTDGPLPKQETLNAQANTSTSASASASANANAATV